MHRRAILSDIHGNLPALEAVLDDIKTQRVDEIVCLGDICGYGPQPLECIRRVREAASWVLLGNHDEAIFKEPVDFSRNAYDAILWQRKLLDPSGSPDSGELARERWEWLNSLPPRRNEKNVCFVHASPRDPLHEYVLKEDFDPAWGGPTPAGKAIFEAIEWLCFCGHSHRPGVVAEDYKWWQPEELNEGRCVLRPGFKTIVNAGSVGQPRDGHPQACYVLLDMDPLKESPAGSGGLGSDANLGFGATIVIPKPKHKAQGTPASPAPAPPQNFAGEGLLDDKPSEEASVGEETRLEEPVRIPPGAPHDPLKDETRTEQDYELQQARKTLLLRSPKVIFRRVNYDVAEAQARFFAVPELPQYNGLRLAKGV
jgi:predicted phosphodiesterase